MRRRGRKDGYQHGDEGEKGKYPLELCKAIREGLECHLQRSEEHVHSLLQLGEEGETYYDDITGEELPHDLLVEARRIEIKYYRQMKVYTKVPWKEAIETTGKAPIKVRWVDVNKGTQDAPDIRPRLVAKEIKKSERPDLFAGAPPLEALRLMLSMAASSNIRDTCLMHNDVYRGYFHASAARPV